MWLTPRAVAFLLAGCIALITTAFLSLVPGTPGQAMLVAACLAFASAFILIYLALELFIFREITRIYEVLNALKKKDATFKIKRKKLTGARNPLKRLNDEIFSLATRKQAEIDELRRTENFRREFLADVSHELKTPIFAAQGFVHTLLDGAVEDPTVRDKFLQKAARSLDGLDALVQDLLTLSRMESGTIRMRLTVVALPALVREVFEQLEEQAVRRRVRLLLRCDEEATARVRADPHRLRQVLSNLIGNAIKHGAEQGTVTVTLAPVRAHVELSVGDDGPGMTADHLKRIFERFYRVDRSRSKDTGGSGLGLAIVKHVVEAHGATIAVRSQPGQGTTFTFQLPQAPPPAGTTTPAPGVSTTAGPSRSTPSSL